MFKMFKGFQTLFTNKKASLMNPFSLNPPNRSKFPPSSSVKTKGILGHGKIELFYLRTGAH